MQTLPHPTQANALAPLQRLAEGPLRGVYPKLDARIYHGQPELSKSMLDVFHACPLDYADARIGKLKRTVTEAMQFGQLEHAVALEDRHDYHLIPATYPSKDGDKPWHSGANYCREWLREHDDKPCITASEKLFLIRCRDAVYSDARCRELLDVATGFEVSLFADHAQVPEGVKARPDVVAPQFLADLKTCSDASPRAVSRMIADRRYHVQAAWYLDTAKLCGLQMPDKFAFIFLQKSDPPRLNVRWLKPSAIQLGREEYQRDLDTLMECRESGDWPGFSGGADDGIGDVDVPAWCYSAALQGCDVDLVFPEGKAVVS